MVLQNEMDSVKKIAGYALAGALPERCKRFMFNEELVNEFGEPSQANEVRRGRKTGMATMLSAGLHVLAAGANVWQAQRAGNSLLDDVLSADVPDYSVLAYTIIESSVRALLSYRAVKNGCGDKGMRSMHLGSLVGYAASIPVWCYDIIWKCGVEAHAVVEEGRARKRSREKGE